MFSGPRFPLSTLFQRGLQSLTIACLSLVACKMGWCESPGFRVLAENCHGTQNSPPVYCNGKIFYLGRDRRGSELWVCGGGSDAHCVMDIFPGPGGSNPRSMIALGSQLVFTASRSKERGDEWLWVSDGTEQGTVWIPQARGRISWLAPNDAGLFFLFDGTHASGYSIWHGAEGEFRRLDHGQESLRLPLLAFDAGVLFHNSQGLWRYAPSAEHADMISPAHIERTNSNVTERHYMCAELNCSLVFPGEVPSGNGGTELWITDGTKAGTRCIKDLGWYSSSKPSWLTSCGDFVFFAAQVEDKQQGWGNEPCRSDGTAEGTFLLKDLAPRGA